jgi:hypothetical protein
MQCEGDKMSIERCPYCGYFPTRCADLTRQTVGQENMKECGVVCDGCGAEGPKEDCYEHAIISWNKVSEMITEMKKFKEKMNDLA